MSCIARTGLPDRAIGPAGPTLSPPLPSKRLDSAKWACWLRQAREFGYRSARAYWIRLVWTGANIVVNSTRPSSLGASRRIEPRSILKAMHVCRPWTQIGTFVVLSAFWSPVLSQIDRSAYRYSTIAEIVAKHGLKVGSSESAKGDSALIAPEYKYRLKLKATGRIRELTPDAAAALTAWSQTHPDLPAFVKEYTHEVEVVVDEKPVWLIWQRSLVAPFGADRSSGGDIEVYAILGGTFHGKLLLAVTAFGSLR